MILIIVMATIVLAGITAIALAHPRSQEIVVWNDEAERRLLREQPVRAGWW